jgi:hypothetical protein
MTREDLARIMYNESRIGFDVTRQAVTTGGGRPMPQPRLWRWS